MWFKNRRRHIKEEKDDGRGGGLRRQASDLSMDSASLLPAHEEQVPFTIDMVNHKTLLKAISHVRALQEEARLIVAAEFLAKVEEVIRSSEHAHKPYVRQAKEMLESPQLQPFFEELRGRAAECLSTLQDWESDNWTLCSVKAGVSTWWKRDPDNGTLWIKMQGMMEDVSVMDQLAIVREVDLFGLWVPICRKAYLLKRLGPVELLNYIYVTVPGFSRDAVLHAYACDSLMEENCVLIQGKSKDSMEGVEIPVVKEWGYARMQVHGFKAKIEVISPNAANTSIVCNVDPKVPIPPKLLEYLLKTFAGFTLWFLVKAAKKISTEPDNPHRRRIIEDVEFYRDWMLPKFVKFYETRGWTMTAPAYVLGEAADEQDGVDDRSSNNRNGVSQRSGESREQCRCQCERTNRNRGHETPISGGHAHAHSHVHALSRLQSLSSAQSGGSSPGYGGGGGGGSGSRGGASVASPCPICHRQRHDGMIGSEAERTSGSLDRDILAYANLVRRGGEDDGVQDSEDDGSVVTGGRAAKLAKLKGGSVRGRFKSALSVSHFKSFKRSRDSNSTSTATATAATNHRRRSSSVGAIGLRGHRGAQSSPDRMMTAVGTALADTQVTQSPADHPARTTHSQSPARGRRWRPHAHTQSQQVNESPKRGQSPGEPTIDSLDLSPTLVRQYNDWSAAKKAEKTQRSRRDERDGAGGAEAERTDSTRWSRSGDGDGRGGGSDRQISSKRNGDVGDGSSDNRSPGYRTDGARSGARGEGNRRKWFWWLKVDSGALWPTLALSMSYVGLSWWVCQRKWTAESWVWLTVSLISRTLLLKRLLVFLGMQTFDALMGSTGRREKRKLQHTRRLFHNRLYKATWLGSLAVPVAAYLYAACMTSPAKKKAVEALKVPIHAMASAWSRGVWHFFGAEEEEERKGGRSRTDGLPFLYASNGSGGDHVEEEGGLSFSWSLLEECSAGEEWMAAAVISVHTLECVVVAVATAFLVLTRIMRGRGGTSRT